MDLSSLNPDQRRAVETTDGPMMILAGAGSGKTKTLVTKIAYLLEEKDVVPYQILALTFSNKAAREMRERITKQLRLVERAIQVTTFHSFCANLLRMESQYLGLSKSFTIYDDGESKSIVKTLLQRRGISPKDLSPYDILAYIDNLKNLGFYQGRENYNEKEVNTSDPFYGYYQEYEAELHRANAVDFGGLITGVVSLWERFPEVLARYQARYRYLLVDEYQDTNRAQFDLIRLLSHETRNVCVVGDEDQSIYSWRGADIRNILDFEKTYPEAKLLKLEQNYRSSKNIIEAASYVINKNIHRKGKKMWTANPEGEAIEVYECNNEKAEGEFIAKEILKLKSENVPLDEMAIFYRTNAQSRAIEDALRTVKIPYRVVGGTKFYDRKEVKDMLAYLRLVVNGKDSLAFGRIINVPVRGIGATSLRKIEDEAVRQNMSLLEFCQELVENPEKYFLLKLSNKVRSSLSEFVGLIQEAAARKETMASAIYQLILENSGYLDAMRASRDYESQARVENLEELASAIKQYESGVEAPSLAGFLETITLDSSSEHDEYAASQGEVSLMTVHGAKGLEFYYVFVAGIEETLFPSFRSIEGGEFAIEEERRLFYVAMTRAMKKLYMTFAQGRLLFGQVKFNGPSRFLMEIPKDFYRWIRVKSEAGAYQNNSDYDDMDQSGYSDDGPVIQRSKLTTTSLKPAGQYAKGIKVIHSLYGAGTVLDTEGQGIEEKVTIRFRDGARKKFLVKFAPLTLDESARS